MSARAAEFDLIVARRASPVVDKSNGEPNSGNNGFPYLSSTFATFPSIATLETSPPRSSPAELGKIVMDITWTARWPVDFQLNLSFPLKRISFVFGLRRGENIIYPPNACSAQQGRR